jgi:acetolactate synthase-1/2/3 large subunit
VPLPTPSPIDPHFIQRSARVLREKKNVLLLLGGKAVHERAQRLIWRIAAMTGAKLMTEAPMPVSNVVLVVRSSNEFPMRTIPRWRRTISTQSGHRPASCVQ